MIDITHRGGVQVFNTADDARRCLAMFDGRTIDTDEARKSIATCRKKLDSLERKIDKMEAENAGT